MVKKTAHYLKHSIFLRNVLLVLSGTTLAQALPIALSPLLTRMYSPELFGILGVFVSLASILGVFSSLGYHKSLLVPKRLSGLNLLILTSIISFSIAAVLFIVFCGVSTLDWIPDKFESIRGFLYVLPISVFLFAMYDALYCWVNRGQNFKVLGLSKIAQSFFLVLVQLGLGFFHRASYGLVAGYIAGQLAAVVVLFRTIMNKNKNAFRHFSFYRAKLIAKRHIKFPIFTLPAELINNIAGQLPTILFTTFFSLKIVGFYHLTNRVLSVPISLLATAVTDVFRERAAKEFREKKDCRDIFMKTFKLLVLLGIIPSLLLFIFSPMLFPFVFGPGWEEAGLYARILTPLFFIRFVVSPLSYIFYIAEKINYDLIWQSVLLVVTVISIGIGIHYNSPKISISLFSISYSLMYVVYFFMSYSFSKESCVS